MTDPQVFILEGLFSVAVGGFSNVTMRFMVMAFSVLPFFTCTEHICKYSVKYVIRQFTPEMTDGQLSPIINPTLEYLQVYSGYHQHWTALVTSYI